MPVQAVNNHAVRKYAEFEFSIQQIANTLADSEALLAKLGESAPKRVKGFKVPDKKEIVGLRTKALEALDVLRKSSKTWEAELLANGWRV